MTLEEGSILSLVRVGLFYLQLEHASIVLGYCRPPGMQAGCLPDYFGPSWMYTGCGVLDSIWLPDLIKVEKATIGKWCSAGLVDSCLLGSVNLVILDLLGGKQAVNYKWVSSS